MKEQIAKIKENAGILACFAALYPEAESIQCYIHCPGDAQPEIVIHSKAEAARIFGINDWFRQINSANRVDYVRSACGVRLVVRDAEPTTALCILTHVPSHAFETDTFPPSHEHSNN